MSSWQRWLVVIVPVGLVMVFELVTDQMLDAWEGSLDVLLVPPIILLFTVPFARFAFRRIDRLSEAVRERNAELERRNATLEALRSVGLGIATLVRIDDVFRTIVESARRLLGADVALIALELPTGTHRLAAFSGPTDGTSAREEADDPRGLVDSDHLRAQLAAPLQRGDTTIGVLLVGSGHRSRPYGLDEFEILSALANQAAIAVENDRLQIQLREVAILSERERIAREMHDGLAQVLGYVNTKAQAVEELLATGQSDRARQHLSELATAARSVYADVREAILGLRSPIAPERGLVGALEEYVQRFSAAAKVVTSVEATPPARSLVLAPLVEAEVFRIVQEALTNVRKHAAARRARVDLDVQDGALTIAVEDDGRGFDAAVRPADDWPHFGMQAICDRAEAIGGEAAWSARPGAGAILRLVVPLAAAPAGAP